jgi:cell division protein FtsA
VLTGGTGALPGIRTVASRVLGVPVRIAKPENLIGMTDYLDSPAFSTSIGLLRWGMLMSEVVPQVVKRRSRLRLQDSFLDWESIKNLMKRLLP